MSNVHLIAFNNTLLDLLTCVETALPEDPYVQTQREPLEMALRFCSSTAIQRFMSEMLTHGKQVDQRDEGYFLEQCKERPNTAIGADLWIRMDKALRESVWDRVQKMKKLATLYYSS